MARKPLVRRIVRRIAPGAPVGEVTRPAERAYEVEGPGGPIPVVEQGPTTDPGRPAVVIVHGGTGDLTAWTGVADRLAGEFRVLRYTRPTYRWRPAPRGAAAATAEVADAAAVARSVGGPVLMVGHSSGAVVALQTALVDPEAFAGLVLYEPPLGATHTPAGRKALRRARAAVDRGRPVAAMRIHLTEFVRLPWLICVPITLLPPARRFFGGFADGQIADNEMLDSLPTGVERFATLELPVVLITGEKSPAHLRDRSDRLAAVLPNPPERVELAGQGHGANLGAPDAVAQIVAHAASVGKI